MSTEPSTVAASVDGAGPQPAWRFGGPAPEGQGERRRVGVAEQECDLCQAEVTLAYVFQGEVVPEAVEYVIEAGSERCQLPRQRPLADTKVGCDDPCLRGSLR